MFIHLFTIERTVDIEMNRLQYYITLNRLIFLDTWWHYLTQLLLDHVALPTV